jgi:hypothetical protein
LEANPEEMESEAEHEVVPKEEAALEILEHWRSGIGTGIWS